MADNPGRHPAYLHALTDLRFARAHLDRPTPDYRLNREEEHAIREIDAAIHEIKRAAINDGKDISHHPPVDANLRRTDRYHRALELLNKVFDDVNREEDQPDTRGLQRRALIHIDEARRIVRRAIETAER